MIPSSHTRQPAALFVLGAPPLASFRQDQRDPHEWQGTDVAEGSQEEGVPALQEIGDGRHHRAPKESQQKQPEKADPFTHTNDP